ncbi:MAG: adenine-specific methyltransferase EcoRI family protein [Treponema sp.]|nr:adenine-specific methyltransferase EcoRI family protein [Treponema sp.]
MKNTDLNSARENKADEFYTQLTDIEKEMVNYKDHFKNKVILCNCDDPRLSNFFKYFALNFNFFGLKKLISVCYKNQDFDLFSQNDCEKAVYVEYTGSEKDHIPTNDELEIKELKGDGDFRSKECIELLKQSDIVITNPPFSLFREYVAQLMKYEKKFIILGNINAITYKEVFPLIQENKLWLGQSIHSGDREFGVPDNYPLKASGFRIDDDGKKFIRVKGVRWFSNLDYKDRHENLILYETYTPEKYPKYDNYDAIEVSKTSEIPNDYSGWMGVPITFLDKYNPDQFEIIGIAKRGAGDPSLKSKVYTKADYPNYSDLNATPVLIKNGELRNTYPRILIRKK